MSNIALAAANFLEAAGISLTKGTNLFVGGLEASPKNGVFIELDSGQPPIRVASGTVEILRSLLFLRVRWADFETGFTTVSNVRTALRNAELVDSGSEFLDIDPRQSEASLVGRDESGSYLWTMSYEVTRTI